MSPDFVTVTPEMAETVIARVLDAIGPSTRVMPIGGTLVQSRGAGPSTETQDVDIVVVLVRDDGFKVPPYEDVMDLAERLTGRKDRVRGRKDHTSVQAHLPLQQGLVKVELIRGRQPAKGGYFVSRNVLERCAELAEERDGVLELPLEALAFLKAWGCHDKLKLVEAGKDGRGYHARRADGFRADVEMLFEEVLGRGREPRLDVLDALFDVASDDRTEAISAILADAGWPVGDVGER